jgi:hypothetical protein
MQIEQKKRRSLLINLVTKTPNKGVLIAKSEYRLPDYLLALDKQASLSSFCQSDKQTHGKLPMRGVAT